MYARGDLRHALGVHEHSHVLKMIASNKFVMLAPRMWSPGFEIGLEVFGVMHHRGRRTRKEDGGGADHSPSCSCFDHARSHESDMLFVHLTISKSSGQFFSLAVCFVSQAVSSDIPSSSRVEDNYGDKR